MNLLAYALTAGAFATLNPCGFALLPATLGRFLAKGKSGVWGGFWLGLLLGLGAFSTFAVIGFVLSLLGTALGSYIPYVNLGLSLILIGLGLATVLGRGIGLNLATRAPRGEGVGEFYLFGVAYGLASLGCTLPVFLAIVGIAFAQGAASGLVALLGYGAGMASVLVIVGVLAGLGKEELLKALRRAGVYLEPIGGVLLMLAGGYLLGYQLDFLTQRQGLTWQLALAGTVLGGLIALIRSRRAGAGGL